MVSQDLSILRYVKSTPIIKRGLYLILIHFSLFFGTLDHFSITIWIWLILVNFSVRFNIFQLKYAINLIIYKTKFKYAIQFSFFLFYIKFSEHLPLPQSWQILQIIQVLWSTYQKTNFKSKGWSRIWKKIIWLNVINHCRSVNLHYFYRYNFYNNLNAILESKLPYYTLRYCLLSLVLSKI